MSLISDDNLQAVLESIESISSSDVSEAMIIYNKYGIVPDDAMHYSRVVYEHGKISFIEKLKDIGFRGEIHIVGKYREFEGNVYVVYDSSIYSSEEALVWLDGYYDDA